MAIVMFSQNSMDHCKTVWKIYGSQEAGKSDETDKLSLVQLNAMKSLLVLVQEQFKRFKNVLRVENAAKIKVKSLALRFEIKIEFLNVSERISQGIMVQVRQLLPSRNYLLEKVFKWHFCRRIPEISGYILSIQLEC